MQPGAEAEVEIERILPGGMGLAHAEGQTLLVALAAPGDRLRVRVRQVRGRVAFASIVEVLAPGPARVEPPCPYFGRCGGCDFQQLNYEAQLAAKVEIIRDCLQRVAHITPPAHIPITPSPIAWRYRSRAQWQYDPRRPALGYFSRGSHEVCDVVECPVVVPALQDALTSLRRRMHERTLSSIAVEFQAAAGDDGVTLSPSTDDERAGDTRRTERANLRQEQESDEGRGDSEHASIAAEQRESVRRIGGESYRFNADCFFQINHELLEPLIREAIAGANDAAREAHNHASDAHRHTPNPHGDTADKSTAATDGSAAADDASTAADDAVATADDASAAAIEMNDGTAVDLYCGVGLFTLPLARRFARVVGVEGNAAACAYARRNLSDAHLTNASIKTSNVGEWLAHNASRLAPVSFVLLDPPRAGADGGAIEGIVALKPERISYVSCDPATLARDLRVLVAAGYRLDSLRAFDMFPQTHHVETVARLSK